jgi:hypothetical protein
LISLTSILKFMIHEFYVNDFRYIVPSGLGIFLCLIDIRRCVAFSYHQLQWTNQYIKLAHENFCHVLIKLHYSPLLPEYFIIFRDQFSFVLGYLLFYIYCLSLNNNLSSASTTDLKPTTSRNPSFLRRFVAPPTRDILKI